MKHYLNVCDVNGAKVEPVDLIAFGSPCQDLSVAGKRAGLKHESNGDDETTRSGLFMEAVRIIKEMRKEDEVRRLQSGRTDKSIRPRFAVWENVPGAFSSNKGEDFRVVLEELARIKDKEVSIPLPNKGKWQPAGEIVGDGWSIAWRTLDAQYHGVAQRRRRIFLVADFADQCAGEILFECKGLPGYPSESSEKGKGIAGDTSKSVGGTSEGKCLGFDSYNQDCFEEVAQTLKTNGGGDSIAKVVQPIVMATQQGGAEIMVDKCPTITASAGMSGNNQPVVCLQGSMIGRKDENCPQGDGINVDKSFTLNTIDRHAVAYGICSYASNSMKSDNTHSGIYVADTARTLDLNGGNPACNQGGICICEPISIENHPNDSRVKIREDGTVQSLTSRMGTGGGNVPLVAQPWSYQKVTGPLMASGYNKLGTQEAMNDMFVTEPTFAMTTGEYMQPIEGKCATLLSRDYKDPQIICYGEGSFGDFVENKISTLKASGGNLGGGSETLICERKIKYIVRRLTPTECARLQGMPDWWCLLSQIDDMSDEDYEFWKEAHKVNAEINGKTYREKTKEQMIKWYNGLQADSSEYKAYGNGMALPCVRVPIHGIAKHGAKTMASLFDGIGGFPLAGLMDGIQTLWTSEIELFPIAVTKERFG